MIAQQVLIAFVTSFVIVVAAVRQDWLTASGAAAALVVGTLTLGFGGWLWGTLLGLFFISSSVLSRFKRAAKQQVAAEKFAKGHQRDWAQALANGGMGALLAVGHALFPSPLWLFAFAGAIGTVTADTWATELGTLSRRQPRLITSGQPVEPGTSGGITLLGTLVSLLCAATVGAVAAVWQGQALLLLSAALGGLAGSLCDSLLGATVQRLYWDDVRQKETEKAIVDGRKLQPVRGWSWMNNDMVNFLASVAGGLLAAAVAMI